MVSSTPQFPVLLLPILLYSSSIFLVNATVDFEHPNATLTKIAFGSCHNARKLRPPNQIPIWKALQAEAPQLFVWTGDAVYPKQRKAASVEYLQQLYHEMHTNTTLGYTQFAQQTPYIYGGWDDHDYGANDAGWELPHKAERMSAYYHDFLKLRSSATPKHEGLYYSVTFGSPPHQVKLIVLDTRSQRGPHCIPSIATKIPLGAGLSAATRWLLAGLKAPEWLSVLGKDCYHTQLLGADQWEWLKQELSSSRAQINLVVSSIQFLTTHPAYETWSHFPAERSRLLHLLARHSSNANAGGRVVVLSGDVHHAELLDPTSALLATATHTTNQKQSFVEVTSSGLTHHCEQPFYGFLCSPMLEHYNANRMKKQQKENGDHDMESSRQQQQPIQMNDNYYIGRNYGVLEIDWDQQQFVIQIKNDRGDTVLQTPWPFQRQDPLTDDEIQQIPSAVDGHLWPIVKLFLLVALVLSLMVARSLRQRPAKASTASKSKVQ